MPPLEDYPKSHVVTYMYYVGVIHFLEEDYGKVGRRRETMTSPMTGPWLIEGSLGGGVPNRRVETMPQGRSEESRVCATVLLTPPLSRCSSHSADEHIEPSRLILTYLIPCHLITTHTLPSSTLLASFPPLQRLFDPVCRCIKNGDLAGFDAALIAGEDAFVRRRIYLTLERGRDLALRNLFRKVFVIGGFEPVVTKTAGAEEVNQPATAAAASIAAAATASVDSHGTDEKRVRRTRIPVGEFAAAVRLGIGRSGDDNDNAAAPDRRQVDNDEVECLLASLIYKVCSYSYPHLRYTFGRGVWLRIVIEPHQRLH